MTPIATPTSPRQLAAGKGKCLVTLRIPPEIRKKLNIAARAAGMSLNQWASLTLVEQAAGILGGDHATRLGEFAATIPRNFTGRSEAELS